MEVTDVQFVYSRVHSLLNHSFKSIRGTLMSDFEVIRFWDFDNELPSVRLIDNSENSLMQT